MNYISAVPRPFTLMLQKTFQNKKLVGAEIGFGVGENAVNLLSVLNIEKLYCIDPCIQDGTHSLSSYLETKKLGTVEFVNLSSDDAKKTIPHNLDFVYVDGDHSYKQCLRDLQNYFELVQPGGFIGGHDFIFGMEKDVVKAVLDFSVAIGVLPSISIPDFWFRKQGENKE